MKEKKCIGWKRMMEVLTKLNPSDKFCVAEYYPVKIRGTAKPENLVLPEGYYYSQKYGITNRAHTLYVKSSTYEYFEYEWDSVMPKVQDNTMQFLVRTF